MSAFSRVFLLLIAIAGLAVVLIPNPSPAQPPNAPPPADGTEVLARGPVHEAFASTYEQPAPSQIVPKMPPAPVEELPPDQKPDGDNVQWIPGYWQWDDERTDFIWVSGFWRVPPPNRVWIPGNWQAVQGGGQWVPGYWHDNSPAQQPNQVMSAEVQYLPPPPQSIEAGPTIPAPVATDIYVPGSWMWRGRFLWRPGFWVAYRPNWLWVPAHFRWTPVGYLFVDGYWDYPLATRGVLFAPTYFPQNVYAQPGFVYTPAYVVSVPCMEGALFARRGYGNYYFGDYFDARYANTGFRPWCSSALAVGGGERRWSYDPLWSHYNVENRGNAAWRTNVTTLYDGRFRGDVPRPGRTLNQQNTNIQQVTNVRNVTNVTNTMTVNNRNVTINNTNVTNVAMLAPLSVVHQLQPETKISAVTPEVRRQEQAHAVQLRQFSAERTKQEATILARGNVPTKPTDAPITQKYELPKVAAARSQAIVKNPPPAAPVHAAVGTPNAVAPHPGNPGGHILDPRVEHPAAKVEPKKPNPPVVGKEDHPMPPVITPKVDRPAVPPVVAPKVEHPIQPPPHVVPPVPAKVQPPVIPPPVPPKVQPPVQPKVETPHIAPSIPPKVQPPVQPKVEPIHVPAPAAPMPPHPAPTPREAGVPHPPATAPPAPPHPAGPTAPVAPKQPVAPVHPVKP